MKNSLFALALLFSAAFAQAQSGSDSGAIRATTTIHQDGTRSVTIVDPEKSTAEETQTDSSGKVLRKVTYLLDDRKQPMGSIAYDAKGNVLYRTTYKRDGMDRVDEESISGADGRFMRRRVYTYGAQNKVTNVVEYDAAGNVISAPKPATTSSRRRR